VVFAWRSRTSGTIGLREIAGFYCLIAGPDPPHIVRESTDGKDIASAYRDYGYTLSEIAEHLGVHYSTASRRLGQHETGS